MAQEPHAKFARSVHEAARDDARAIAKTEAYAKNGHVHTSRLWPAKEQAVSKLRVVIEDLDLALDDLEEALTITRNGLAKTINSFIAGKPLDEETFKLFQPPH
jgi:hypothetical protein